MVRYHDVGETEEDSDYATDDSQIEAGPSVGRDFSPMNIESSKKETTFSAGCRKAATAVTIVSVVTFIFISIASVLEAKTKSNTKLQYNQSLVINGISGDEASGGRDLVCHQPNEISGGSTGGHCQTVFSMHTSMWRNVTNLPNGMEALTHSNDKKALDAIESHVNMMKMMTHHGHKIHQHDPLFQMMFSKKWVEKINIQVSRVEGAIKVTQTSNDPCAIELIQVHAQAVTQFVNRGIPEFLCEHKVPACVFD